MNAALLAMRLKVILPLAGFALLIVCGLFVISNGRHRSAEHPNPPFSSAEMTNEPASLVRAAEGELLAPPLSSPQLRPAAQPGATDSAANYENYVQRRVNELHDLSANNDSNSLAVILLELTNRDREIRKAALESTIQFGSRDAIPRLLELAAEMEDPAERAEFVEAAEYLKLPTLTEVLAQRKGMPPPPKTPAQTRRHNIPAKQTAPQ